MKNKKKLIIIVATEIIVFVTLGFILYNYFHSNLQKSAFERIQDEGYRGTQEEFLASLAGEASSQAEKTAYEIAQEKGFQGDLVDWFDILLSANDVELADSNSDSSSVQKDRTSYEIAKEKGFEGNEKDWILLIVRASDIYSSSGLSSYDIAVQCGYTGELSEWLESLII